MPPGEPPPLLPADPLDDPAIRQALAAPLGLDPFTLPGCAPAFQRRHFGLTQVELGPLGLSAPVCADPAALEAMRSLLREAPRHAARVRVTLSPFEPQADVLVQQARQLGYQVLPLQTHVLELQRPLEAIRAGYHATKRAQVRRAPKVESAIACTRDPAALQGYFEVYAASAQRWGRGAPPYPRALFEALLRSPCTQLWTHHVAGRLACAMVVLAGREQALYWQGVSHIEDDQKPAHPMARLFDAVVQGLVGQGVAHFNLGASDGLPSVRRFKEEFGAQPRAYTALLHESRRWRLAQALAQGARRIMGAVKPAAQHG
ncbi:MAG: GNAT family N-acetyltransferase [Rubrivivax sp.]